MNTPAIRSAGWASDAIIYSVYLRSFSPEGTLQALTKKIPDLKKLGISVLWLLPIHPIGRARRKGKLGSPYSVRDYYAINPEYGTMADFKRLVATVHKHGMKLIIDLVANHTSWDSRLMLDHPEWFTRNRKGKIVSPNKDWTDVADLDYRKPELRQYMMEMMKWWVRDIGIDGFRCDVAELVPTDFWNDARRELNVIKPVMMLSEGSIPEHHLAAFDVTYSWNIYDVLKRLAEGERPVSLIDRILLNERRRFPKGSLRMRFVTNHDKNAWIAPAVDYYGADGLKLVTVLCATLPGIPMIYNGEEVANNRKLSLFRKVPIDWGRPKEMWELYWSLFQLRKKHVALRRGEMTRLSTGRARGVYAFVRSSGRDRVLVVLNFSPSPRTVAIDIRRALGKSETSMRVHEALTGRRMSAKSGALLSLELEPKSYSIIVRR